MGILQSFIKNLKKEKIFDTEKSKNIDFSKMTLMHKDSPIVDIEFANGRPKSADNLRDINKLPVKEQLRPFGINQDTASQLTPTQSINLNHFVMNWLSGRCIPKGRPNLDLCLQKCGAETPEELMCKTLGLSLTDNYWLKPQNANITWKDVNLRENGFSPDVGDMLINAETNRPHMNLYSPDATTVGEDAKRWVYENGEAYLMKTNPSYEQVAYNETVSSLIAQKLGLRCAEYSVEKGTISTKYINGSILESECTFSKSKNFCKPNREYFPAMYLPEGYKKLMFELKNDPEIAGLKHTPMFKDFQKMLVLDFIINNEDRHEENFGFEIDEKGEYHFAPVFDNGNSLFYKKENDNQIGESSVFIKCKFNGAYDNFLMMAKGIQFKDELGFFDIEKFKNIKEEVLNIFRESSMSEERIQALSDYIENQIQEVQKFKDRLPERIVIRNEISEEER